MHEKFPILKRGELELDIHWWQCPSLAKIDRLLSID